MLATPTGCPHRYPAGRQAQFNRGNAAPHIPIRALGLQAPRHGRTSRCKSEVPDRKLWGFDHSGQPGLTHISGILPADLALPDTELERTIDHPLRHERRFRPSRIAQYSCQFPGSRATAEPCPRRAISRHGLHSGRCLKYVGEKIGTPSQS